MRRDAAPGELVTTTPDPLGGRLAVLCRPTSPALVLGSAQAESLADQAACAAAGIEVVRRRSGGGALLVAPGGQVWLDVFVPAGDPLAEADVGRATWWLGELWSEVLEGLAGPGRAVVHRGGVEGRFSRLVCFSGLGPGEVSIDGAKVVGISQRRTRAGAWLHSMALVGAPPPGSPPAGSGNRVAFLDLLDLPEEARSGLASDLESRVRPLSPAEASQAESSLEALLASFGR